MNISNFAFKERLKTLLNFEKIYVKLKKITTSFAIAGRKKINIF